MNDNSRPGDLRLFQFSLMSALVMITVAALLLSGYFGVGRLLGMSTMEVLTQGLARLLMSLPVLLVWTVGLTIAFRHLRRNRLPATLTIIALGVLVVSTLVSQVIQMALLHSVNSNRISAQNLGWGFTLIGIVHAALNTSCWILILVAIFVRRPPDAPDDTAVKASQARTSADTS